NQHSLRGSAVCRERLAHRGVVEAIRLSEEVRGYYGLTVEVDLAELIATELLADDRSAVAPTLQVILSTMWLAARERDLARPHFDFDLYRRLKRQGIHLDDFLERQLQV